MVKLAVLSLGYVILAGMAWAFGKSIVELAFTPLWRTVQ